MKKIIVVVSIICMLFGCVGCSTNTNNNNTQKQEITEGKYPSKWDDTLIFKDEADMEATFNELMKWPEEIKKYQGKLNTVDGLYGYISTLYSYDFNVLYDRFNAYSTFGSSVFPLEQKYIDCSLKLNEFKDAMESATSYFDEEMASIPYKTRVQLFTDEKIIEYIDLYYNYLAEDLSVGDQYVMDVFNTMTSSYGRSYKLHDILVNFTIPDVEYKLKNGEIVNINNGNINTYLAGDYNADDKLGLYNAYWKQVSNYADALTYVLETEMMEQAAFAEVNGYSSSRYMSLDNMGFNEDIIQKIIDYAHNNSDSYKKYYSLYADENGKCYSFSKGNSLSNYKTGYINYDDGVDDVINALSVLGDEYKNNLIEIFESGHIDVYPNDNKSTGAFEIGNYAGQNPFVMFNYDGSVADVADIAHEMGHACYDKLSNANQPIYNWGNVTFTQEVASITNELMYYEYKINNAETDDEKICYLEAYLSRWGSDMYGACMQQEFENYCHDTVEAGGYLNSQDLYDKWQELSNIYSGENVDQGEYGNYKWLTISGMYNNYYQYQYATSLCYATVLSQKIMNNEPGVCENYLDFLKAGVSVHPIDALAIAGIDIYDDNVYNQAFAHYEEMVEKLANLAKK